MKKQHKPIREAFNTAANMSANAQHIRQELLLLEGTLDRDDPEAFGLLLDINSLSHIYDTIRHLSHDIQRLTAKYI